jgi:Xaa-Pro aminopeptidase
MVASSNVVEERRHEVESKLTSVRRLLDEQKLSGLILSRPGSISWATAGAENPIVRGADGGAFCWILATAESAFAITQNVEGPRLVGEEQLGDLGFEVIEHPWYAQDLWGETVRRLAGNTVGADVAALGADLSVELIRLRLPLLPSERKRYRALGIDGARSVEEALGELKAGESEREIAARVADGCERRGIVPTVLLVGSDARMRRFRHCPPSDATVASEAMVVIVGVREGLNIACTRMASIDPTDLELEKRQNDASAVEAAMIAATVPGSSYGSALQAGIDRYEQLGWPGEHEHHYQGGPIGYDVREFGPAPRSRPNQWTEEAIPDGSAFAWNPTIEGGKSEDTYIALETGPELLTPALSWPVREFEVGGRVIRRPGILEV